MKPAKRLFIICITIFMILVFGGCTEPEDPNNAGYDVQDDSVPVEVVQSKAGSIENTREFSGKLKPAQDIMVIPQIPGKVKKVHVQVGQTVKEGDLLIEIDSTDVEFQVKQAEAAYESASLTVNSSRKQINELKKNKSDAEKAIQSVNDNISGIKKEIQEIDKSIEELDRKLENEEISPEEHKTARLELVGKKTAAEGQKKYAEIQRGELQNGLKSLETTIKSLPSDEQLNAQLKQAQTALDMTKNAENNLELRAPIDGIVSSLMVEEGEVAAQTTPPVTIIDMESLCLDVNLTEFEIGQVESGQEISIYVESAGDDEFKGKIEWVSPSIDQRFQSYPIRIRLDNIDKKLRPGMFGRARIVLDKSEETVIIPKNCLVRENEKVYVFIVDGETVEKREIETGLDTGDTVEVISGLKPNETVVIKGQAFIEEDAKIRVVGEAETK